MNFSYYPELRLVNQYYQTQKEPSTVSATAYNLQSVLKN